MLTDLTLKNFINLTIEDKKLILKWRNNENIRKWMHNNKSITIEEHLNFIESLKIAKDRLYFLVLKEQDYLGVIDFTNIDFENRSTEFGMYANPDAETPGLGRILETCLIEYAFNELNVNTIKLEAFSDNKLVINLHKKFNFVMTEEIIVNGKMVTCMELTR